MSGGGGAQHQHVAQIGLAGGERPWRPACFSGRWWDAGRSGQTAV